MRRLGRWVLVGFFTVWLAWLGSFEGPALAMWCGYLGFLFAAWVTSDEDPLRLGS